MRIGRAWTSGRVWKLLGVAGLAGVAATGAIIARGQRQRAQLSPEQVRTRLHERWDGVAGDGEPGDGSGGRRR